MPKVNEMVTTWVALSLGARNAQRLAATKGTSMGFWDILKSAGTAMLERAAKDAQRKQNEQRERAERMKDSPAYQHGKDNIKTAIILSAPGQEEKKARHPAAGQTGKTLNRVLQHLNKKNPKTFPSTDKRDYPIINAVSKVQYKSKTGRTEGTSSEIKQPKNLERISKSLVGIKNTLALGNKAQEAAKLSGFTGPVMAGSHLSLQNINRNYSASGDTPAKRNEERIKKYANDIIKGKKK
jgi:uracil-DNA glycosylase